MLARGEGSGTRQLVEVSEGLSLPFFVSRAGFCLTFRKKSLLVVSKGQGIKRQD